MNWILIMVVTLGMVGAMELIRRQNNSLGGFLAGRLKTFSARVTVSFLLAFAAYIPFAGIEMTAIRRLMLVSVTVLLVFANLIRLDSREV